MRYIWAIACFSILGCANPQLETRVYHVNPGFWSALPGTNAGYLDSMPAPSDAELERSFADFCACIFLWPNDAMVTLNQTNSTVTLRNTSDTLHKMERWLGVMDGSGVFYRERIE